MLKTILSVFIVFHLACIFILPNPESMLYRATAPVVTTYGNLLGMNTTWRFFSPNPMIRYMEYTVFYRDANKRLMSSVYRYPRIYTEEKFFENYSRKLNNSMYMMMHKDHLRDNFGKILCSWHPEAEVISVAARGRVFPNIEKSQLISGGRSELGEVQTQSVVDIQCKPEAEE